MRRGLARLVRLAGRLWLVLALAAALPGAAQAQEQAEEAEAAGGAARLDVAQSGIDGRGDGLEVRLYLSDPVPWRAFTLDAPPRLVLDFRGLDWRGATRAAMLNADAATDLRIGAMRPGWTRMVVDLAGTLAIETAEMRVDPVDGTALVVVQAAPVAPEVFAARSGALPDPDWILDLARPAPPPPPARDGPLVVAIDPGHGGVDPGAQRAGLDEADLMLTLGRELAAAVEAAGMVPVLTREGDVFVSLAERISRARDGGAHVFLSLHADALEDARARGGSVYVLSREAQEDASQRMAERHGRGDLLAGLDLTGQDDAIATVLMDLARLETAPRSDRLAAALVSGLGESGAPLNSRPRRAARLGVLLAADMPSVLVEAGFLSDPEDRARLASAEGRARIVAGLVAGLSAWALDDADLRGRMRQ